MTTIIITMTPDAQPKKTFWYSFPACTVSLLLALGLSGLVLAYPKIFVLDGVHSVNHGLLTLMMLGISAGFVHGVGFIPRYWLWKLLFAPWTAWSLMLSGFFLILSA